MIIMISQTETSCNPNFETHTDSIVYYIVSRYVL